MFQKNLGVPAPNPKCIKWELPFPFRGATAWAFQKREANSAEQQNINQASCKIRLRSILSHWSETTQSIIQNALVSSHRSSGSILERFSPKKWGKKMTVRLSGGGVHALRGWNKLLPRKTMQSFFWPFPFTNSSKEKTNHLNSCGKKGLNIDGRRASMHTQNKANISPGKNQVNRAVPTKNSKAPLKLSSFFVFCLSSQKTKLWFSERLRKSGIWCLLHLIYRFCPPFSHWGIEYSVKQVLHPVCNLSGNPRLITFFFQQYLAQEGASCTLTGTLHRLLLSEVSKPNEVCLLGQTTSYLPASFPLHLVLNI